MCGAVILAIPALVFPLVLPPGSDCQKGQIGDPEADEQAVIAFEAAADDYAALHRRLAPPWPPAWFISDPEQKERAAQELRVALQRARPQAWQGSLFTPAVADMFRLRIAAALRAQDNEEGGFFSALPILPLELDYRLALAGRYLIVLDVDADLVVDTLDLALLATVEDAEPDEDAEPEEEESIAPAAEEPMGCLYDFGQLPI